MPFLSSQEEINFFENTMSDLKMNTKDQHQTYLINLSTTVGLIIYCTRCKSTICLSITKHNNNNKTKDDIGNHINQFQKTQWIKYGQTMPTNWIDPFEIYD